MISYTIVYEKIEDPSFSSGYYYAHIPSLDLTTHGKGIEGAKEAASDLIRLWIEEKKSNGEAVKRETESFVSTIEIEDAVLR
ncbi:MAG: type II toxin-antitoxin system HicB family antitoxin [Bacteroidota bacterium]|nr:type II toxin-antitoxin system HicB family antitoxin [Bacteroidota bacterium]